MNREETWKRLVELGSVGGEIPAEGGFNLFGARLFGADLNGADLVGAHLSKADLNRTDLNGADLSKAHLIGTHLNGADLIGTHLNGANLNKAHLNGANLNGAHLNGAHLTKADLNGADLSKASLIGAHLNGAHLIGANLRECVLIRADLTKAILNGVNIDRANLAEWLIRDVACNYIVQGEFGKEIRVPFGPKEFEKKYTQIARIVELILGIPLTGSTGFVATAIAQSINHIRKSPVILWKGAEALSRSDTKLTFNVFDADFFEKDKDKFGTVLKTALDDYFKNQDISDHYLGPAENEMDGLMKIKPSFTSSFPPLEIDTKVLEEKALAYFIQMGKIGQGIHKIITHLFPP